ncbi:MAG: hypothetical protein U1E83_07640 [Methylotetracoccus sp.]
MAYLHVTAPLVHAAQHVCLVGGYGGSVLLSEIYVGLGHDAFK